MVRYAQPICASIHAIELDLDHPHQHSSMPSSAMDSLRIMIPISRLAVGCGLAGFLLDVQVLVFHDREPPVSVCCAGHDRIPVILQITRGEGAPSRSSSTNF